VKAYVGVTDGRWYRFLSARPTLTEVNFWRPSSSREFRALDHGEPFFFKTHHPHNRVVGGGFFSGFAPLRVSEAWEFFRQGNGSASQSELRHQIGRYRSQPIDTGEDPVIGCVIIRDVFPDDRIAGPPPDFASNIVQGKSYDLARHPAADYFHDLLHRIGIGVNIDLSEPWHRDGPVYGDPRLAPRRLGQQAFQAVVLHAYERRCAISGDRIRPVLQAVHIRPVAAGGEHRLDNGLLLRSDVHTLTLFHPRAAWATRWF
jgi:putative restriction endonuclease